jgi:hypothetical protein
MSEFLIGTKNYDTDWYLKYGLSYAEAARTLCEWGFSFILTQSRFLPMADSAVTSEVTPEMAARYASYDDLSFREALAKEGVGYWPTLCTFFNPAELAADPSLLPVDARGKPMPTIDWYVGVTPSRSDYVARQVEAILNVVKILDPDGIFLSFIRWPGFWELWMPDYSRDDFPEYSYDLHTIERFSRENKLDLPSQNPVEAAAWIDMHARQAWTDWKCGVITDMVRQVRTAVQGINPDLKIMINTLPFGERDYDNARDKTFGQHLESLSEVVDIFEVMTYHQILKRPVDWIPKIAGEVKRQTEKKTVCTLQVEPLYLEGMHAAEGRSPTIDVGEFSEAVRAVRSGNLDGVVLFVWSDLLRKTFLENDTRWIEALQP